MSWAASVYTSSANTGTVGQNLANLELEYTADTSQQTWVSGDTLTIQLPENLPAWSELTFTAEYDSDTTNNGTGETAISAGGSNGQYSLSTRTMTVRWNTITWGAILNNNSTIRILITANAIPQYANSNSTISFGGSTVSVLDTNPSGSASLNISAADSAASLTLADTSVGASTTSDFALTLPVNMQNSDTITFTLPSRLSSSGSISMSSTTFSGTGTLSCSGSGSDVTCTSSGVINSGSGAITLSNILALASGTGIVISSQVNSTAAAALIASDSTTTVSDITAANANASLSLGTNATVGVSGDSTLTLTLPLALSTGDTVAFTAPSNLNVSNATLSSHSFGGGGSFACIINSQTLTCTVTGTINAGTGTLTFSGIAASYEKASQTSGTTVSESSPSGSMAETATGAVTDTVVGTLTGTNVEPSSFGNGLATTHTVSFSSTAEIPSGGKIEITYPSGFDISQADGASASSLSGLDGTWTADVSGSVLTLTQSGGSTSAAGAKSLQIGNIFNPGQTGSTGTYKLRTTTAANEKIQEDLNVSADTIVLVTEADEGVVYGGGRPPMDVAVESPSEETTEPATETPEETPSEEIEEIVETPEISFSDLSESHPLFPLVEKLVGMEILKGYPDGTLRLEKNLNRAEAIAIVYRLNQNQKLSKESDGITLPFVDTINDYWYADAILALFQLGFIEGRSPEYFKPDRWISAAEFIKILTLSADLSEVSDREDSGWYFQYWQAASQHGLFEYTPLSPEQFISRAQAITLIESTLEAI